MKKTLFIAAALVAALASCQKEESFAPSASTGYRTFTCTIDTESDTKVAVSDAGKVTWEVGDQILVHGEYTTDQAVITLTKDDISADGKVATINVPETVTPYVRDGYTSTYYAGYPASAVANSSHCYYYQKFNNTNTVLMAAYDNGSTFAFKNLCGLIRFNKPAGDFDSYTFEGNNGETVGYEGYQVKLCSKEESFNHKDTSGPKTIISGTLVEGVNTIGLPNGTNFTGGFTIKFKKGDDIIKVATTNTAVDVARNKILVLGDISSHLTDYEAPSGPKGEAIFDKATATDLGATETANCYIIKAAGKYVFPAVKGNSSTSVGDAAEKAKIVWETYCDTNTVTANSVVKKVGFYDGYVYIEMPSEFHAGNALVAVTNATDSILWTWHIWAISETINTISGDSQEIMDRNLGALSADITKHGLNYGMLYQWGRMTPIISYAGTGEKKFAAKYPLGDITLKSLSAPTTVSYAISHPNEFLHKVTCWYTPNTDALWAETKTIYDPCPAGWVVMKFHYNSGVMKDFSSTTASLSESNYCITFNTWQFPASGYLKYDGTLYRDSKYAMWWTTTARSDNYDNAQSNQISNLKQSYDRKASAFSVRCEKIVTE